jgi:hypothetical protein
MISKIFTLELLRNQPDHPAQQDLPQLLLSQVKLSEPRTNKIQPSTFDRIMWTALPDRDFVRLTKIRLDELQTS